MIPEVLKCSFVYRLWPTKIRHPCITLKVRQTRWLWPQNSCHWLSLNFALFISSHMNFENVVCQLHQHYRFPNLFVVGPAYEILDKNPFIHSVFDFTVDTHMTTNRFSHNSTFSFISFGGLVFSCDPNFLFSHRQVMWVCNLCRKTTRKSSPSQEHGSTAAQGGTLPSGVSDPHRRHEEAPQEKKAKLQEAPLLYQGPPGDRSRAPGLPRQASLKNDSNLKPNDPLSNRWVQMIWVNVFLVLKRLRLK